MAAARTFPEGLVVVDKVVLVVEQDSPVVRFVEALGRLALKDMPRTAVIGGVAVMCQLAAAHRPTADVDALARDDAVPSAVEVLMGHGAGRTPHGVELAGVHIDLLEVGDVPAAEALPIDELDRSFVIAHSWALETAEPMLVVARNRAGRTSRSAQVEVATPAALVAMKLHAIRKRRGATAAKRGSDAYDMYRLLALRDADGSIASTLMHAPAGLGAWCALQIEELFVNDVDRTVLWIRNALAVGTVHVVADDLSAVGEAFIHRARNG